ncbi:hypothetical protein ABIA94_002271 [Bradyrhizobium sp. LA7.1]
MTFRVRAPLQATGIRAETIASDAQSVSMQHYRMVEAAHRASNKTQCVMDAPVQKR